jgi:ATP-dependent DNA helicase DinG
VKDRGVLALLDNRLLKQRYGKTFIDSLPAYKKTKDLADVDEFFSAAAAGNTSDPQ